MKRSLLGATLASVRGIAHASGIRANDIAPVIIVPVFAACALGLLIGALIARNNEGAIGWLAGSAVLVFTIALSRLLAEYGYLAAIIPETVVGIALFAWWRKGS